MGRRMEASTRKEAGSFSLRNFALHLNEMEGLGLPVVEYATVMADAYAVMHWKAQVDADDVEFVLGKAPRLKRSQTLEELESGSYLVSHRIGKTFDYTRQTIGMWLIDFNNCQRITLDGKGVKMMVRAFWNNDPYTPRPSGNDDLDAALWLQFRRRYLDSSIELLS
jgi:hypothetical protein